MMDRKEQFSGVWLLLTLTFEVGGICVDTACVVWVHVLRSEYKGH